jgi:hypothetical protein
MESGNRLQKRMRNIPGIKVEKEEIRPFRYVARNQYFPNEATTTLKPGFEQGGQKTKHSSAALRKTASERVEHHRTKVKRGGHEEAGSSKSA